MEGVHGASDGPAEVDFKALLIVGIGEEALGALGKELFDVSCASRPEELQFDAEESWVSSKVASNGVCMVGTEDGMSEGTGDYYLEKGCAMVCLVNSSEAFAVQ